MLNPWLCLFAYSLVIFVLHNLFGNTVICRADLTKLFLGGRLDQGRLGKGLFALIPYFCVMIQYMVGFHEIFIAK